jgi:hypothetical protein
MTATYNLVCPQATTFTFQFRVETDGVPWNLTNYTATMTVRPFINSTTTSLLATTANGKIVLNTGTATATVTFTATETNIKAESYVYDFVFNSGSVITRLLEGKFIVTAGVTV